jgi:radical SAM superfamily enzyme YgiQ (UPF0313 family)
MKWMFNNFQGFIDAVDGKGSLYGEVVETIMGFDPKVVIVLGGEPLIATKDWGNPFIAANFSRMLRRFGVHTVGVGHFFTLDREKFEADFDCILGGEPNSQIVDVVKNLRTGYVNPKPLDLNVVPAVPTVYPERQITDFVMTSFGCRFPCSFCLAQQLYKNLRQPVRFVELDTVVQDIARRPEPDIYLTDLTFTMAPLKRLRALADRLKAANLKKNFTIDTRVDSLSEEIVDLLVELGVTRVKLGIEGMTQGMIDQFNKRTTVDQNKQAVELLRKHDMEVLTYLLIGGNVSMKDYELTADYVKDLAPDFVPVAIWAYNLDTDYRYDTQFSPVRLKEWNISPEIFFKYMELQEMVNPTVGKLLNLD